MKRYKLIQACVCIMLVILLSGCSGYKDKKEPAETSTSFEEQNPETLDDITLEGMVNDVIDQMSLEEKIGQLFVVCTDSLDFNAETEMTDEMKESLQKYQPGGVIFFSFNLKDRQQTMQFINDMQKEVKIPMFISIDEEGGQVERLGNNEEMGVPKFPTMYSIGQTKDSKEAQKIGVSIGNELSKLGFNLDFAPVADLITNKKNMEIGERSFGEDPDLVGQMVAAEVKGLQSTGVSATLKHFPGQGSSAEDTHKGFADVDTTIDEFRDGEFVPFKKGIKAGADFVMTSHIAVNNVTGTDTPASLSSLMVTDILREELGYDGIVITDAMNMKSITKFYESDEAAIDAIKAGNDMILMPDDFQTALEGVINEVKYGGINEETIDASLRRILTTKIQRGVLPLDSDYFK